ncbi:MAG TPA: transposase DNA-binding-containing protein [Gammaproteobacteria bacterium]|jgi:hypothetical protein|nr:transposase DNA-binding-containing protein [Gammaproteobacteria bacterium]
MNIGSGNTEEFISREFKSLELKDKRLNKRAKKVLEMLQKNLTSCVRRMSSDSKDIRQTYDFFFQSQGDEIEINGTPLRKDSRTH